MFISNRLQRMRTACFVTNSLEEKKERKKKRIENIASKKGGVGGYI